jgi:hypothetical protein
MALFAMEPYPRSTESMIALRLIAYTNAWRTRTSVKRESVWFSASQ